MKPADAGVRAFGFMVFAALMQVVAGLLCVTMGYFVHHMDACTDAASIGSILIVVGIICGIFGLITVVCAYLILRMRIDLDGNPPPISTLAGATEFQSLEDSDRAL